MLSHEPLLKTSLQSRPQTQKLPLFNPQRLFPAISQVQTAHWAETRVVYSQHCNSCRGRGTLGPLWPGGSAQLPVTSCLPV